MKPRSYQLAVEALEDRTVPSHITVGAMGDSFTDEYAPYPHGAGGDQNWVEQFRVLRPEKVTIFNQAVSGASSTALIAQGQHTAVADLVREGAIDSALLMVGGRDSFDQLPSIRAGISTPFVTTLLTNLGTALDTILGAGPVNLVIGNIPTPVVAPGIQQLLPPPVQTSLTAAIQLANDRIEQLACERGLPVLDLYGLANLTLGPVTLGGVSVSRSDLFAVDNFHLGTVMQGLIANTFLEALEVAYDVNINPLRLRDHEILGLAGIPHGHDGPTYFDVSPFVIYAPTCTASHYEALTAMKESGPRFQTVLARQIGSDNHLVAGLAIAASQPGTADFDQASSGGEERGAQRGVLGPGTRSAASPVGRWTLDWLFVAGVEDSDSPSAWSRHDPLEGMDDRLAGAFVEGLFSD